MELKVEVDRLKQQYEQSDKDINFLLNNEKENSLIFKGLPIILGEEPEDMVKKFRKDVLGVSSELKIVKAYTLGNSKARNKPILAEFVEKEDKIKIL